MNIIFHGEEDQKIAEIVTEDVVLSTTQDALDLIVKPSLQGARKIILHQENIAPDFFVLRTGLAGDVLQKFVNYRIQLAIVGDFEHVESESLKAFIVECNRGRDVFFAADVPTAVQKLLSC